MKKLFILTIATIFYSYSSSLYATESQSVNVINEADNCIKTGYEDAIKLLSSAQNKSFKGAIENKIGLLYHFSEEIRDFDKARDWYEKAVKKGSGEAANHLGRMYVNGEGVTSDKKIALDWYKTGMNLGDDDAKQNYSTMLKTSRP